MKAERHAIGDAIKLAGGQAELGRRLGVSPAAINQWSAGRRPIPAGRCVAIEKVTDGVVRRWDLRPYDWMHYWPELIGQPGAPDVEAKAA